MRLQKDKGFMPAILLTIICLVTGFLLAFTNQVTEAAIEAQKKISANKDRQTLYSAAKDFEQMDIAEIQKTVPGLVSVYSAKDGSGKLIGYIIETSQKGYGGQVPVMLAVDTGGTVIGIKVLSNEETPGLGKKVENRDFLDQFSNKSVLKGFTVGGSGTSELQPIEAISGATISSTAVVGAVNSAHEAFVQISKGVQ